MSNLRTKESASTIFPNVKYSWRINNVMNRSTEGGCSLNAEKLVDFARRVAGSRNTAVVQTSKPMRMVPGKRAVESSYVLTSEIAKG